MQFHKHRCVTRKIGATHPLAGKTVYVPAMAEGSIEALCAALRWMGVEAYPTPPSDPHTLELGGKHTSGDECYPAKITTGDFLKIAQQPGFDAKHTVFLMGTTDGPCRFGQYAPFLRKVLHEQGYGDIQVLSPHGEHGYSDFQDFDTAFVRTAWRAVVSADILRKLLLQTRPYETQPGEADRAFRESLDDLCQALERSCSVFACQMRWLTASLLRARARFHAVPARFDSSRPLIGIVGEIFCRLNNFSNQDLVRRLEEQGAECWIADIAEWIGYTNMEEVRNLRLAGRSYSSEMIKSKLRSRIQHADEHALRSLFVEDFAGYKEPSVEEVLELAQPYLPFPGAEGEMVTNMGRSAYLALHGVDGIVDISPFTCMNGVVSEAIYPKLSRDYGGVPIRNFYFDGQQSDLDRDIGIYLELARSYREKKPYERFYPSQFSRQENVEMPACFPRRGSDSHPDLVRVCAGITHSR
jgi:predicted nucleotide-binding protein (sugar kinase/HSP70/actin superfamily)